MLVRASPSRHLHTSPLIPRATGNQLQCPLPRSSRPPGLENNWCLIPNRCTGMLPVIPSKPQMLVPEKKKGDGLDPSPLPVRVEIVIAGAYQRNVSPNVILRPGFPTVPFWRPPLVSDGFAKPVPSEAKPASSMNGSTVL